MWLVLMWLVFSYVVVVFDVVGFFYVIGFFMWLVFYVIGLWCDWSLCRTWCPGNPDCEDPKLLCRDLVDDYHSFQVITLITLINGSIDHLIIQLLEYTIPPAAAL